MEVVGELDARQLDALPFGAIGLDRDGTILQYNAAESEISGRSREAVIGRNFFTEVAPCTNVQEFAGRFREGVQREELNHVFPYVFSFDMAPAKVWIRLYYSKDSRTAWVFVMRKEEPE